MTCEALIQQTDRGTTHEAPMVRFERDERAQLRPLPVRALLPRTQSLAENRPQTLAGAHC